MRTANRTGFTTVLLLAAVMCLSLTAGAYGDGPFVVGSTPKETNWTVWGYVVDGQTWGNWFAVSIPWSANPADMSGTYVIREDFIFQVDPATSGLADPASMYGQAFWNHDNVYGRGEFFDAGLGTNDQSYAFTIDLTAGTWEVFFDEDRDLVKDADPPYEHAIMAGTVVSYSNQGGYFYGILQDADGKYNGDFLPSHDEGDPDLSGPGGDVFHAGLAVTDLYVDDDDATCGGNSPCFSTIQAAINAADAGNTIHVAAGTYAETVTLNKSLNLVGAGCGAAMWRGSAITGRSLRIIRNNTVPANVHVEISGFSFETENNQTIFADWSTGYAEAMTLDIHDNCFAHVNSRNPGNDFALYVDGACQVARGAQGAIRVHDNTCDVVTGGVLFENCRAVDVVNNTFRTTYEAVTFNYYSTSATLGEQLVAENVINHVVVDWAFAMNNWHGDGTYTILPSVVTHNVVAGPSFAYAIVYGVVASQTSTHDFRIFDNALLSGSVTVWGDYASQVTLNASGNWWGSAVSPAGRVTGGRVDYTPWLATGTDTGDPGFHGSFSSLWVDDDSPQTGTTGRIQEAIGLVSGSTVNVAAGTYDETLNIEGKSGLSIIGEDKDTTIVKSSTTLPWNIGGHTTGRQTVVRIVNSTGISLSNLTLDGDLIKGNNRYLVTGYDSSAALDDCVLKNMSVDDASAYYELGAYFRAPGYTDGARAAITVTDCTFADCGRVSLVTHDYITATIENCVFYKDFNDFGYAIEMGSQSKGTIRGNKIYGFDTPAASDGSTSGGLYIENCFTNGVVGPIAKTVLIENNDIYGCQMGITVGNEWDGYAGNVDIALTLNNNSIHDNLEVGAVITDEDKSAGSSVSVTGSGNTWDNNGDYGLYVYTQGDGDITVDLTGEIITGNDVGLAVDEITPGASSYAVSIADSSIAGNTSYGVDNLVSSFVLNAEDNWWGNASGPYHPSLNPLGTGNAVSDYVDFDPYMSADPGINILKLDVVGNPVYLQPGDTVTIDMDALNLAQHVLGCQAVLNFSSTYFIANPSGPGAPVVVAGDGPWTELIWSAWNTGGDLDVAIGVELGSVVGTKADGTVAKFTLTAGTTDGTTQMVFRADGGDTASTFFSDTTAPLPQPVNPGRKIDSQTIVIDGTDPVVTVTSPNGGEFLKGGAVHNITWTASDTNIAPNSIQIEYFDGADWQTIASGLANTGTYPWTVPSLNINTALVRVTASDLAGNSASDVSDAPFTIDSTAPAIAITSITPANTGGGGCALQGTVSIVVTASDVPPGSGLTAAPTVTVSGMTVTYDGESPTGTFTYHVTVGAATANGTHTVDASVTDNAGNVGNASQQSFCVNKNQIAVQVELESFVGASRAVAFVATGGAGKTWAPMTLSFSAGMATCTLTDVPDGVIDLSGKTAWSLRNKVALGGGTNGQWTADLTGAEMLPGGDINGTNSVNVLDYGVLKINWFTSNAIADINGDGVVNTLDYSIMKGNWFQTGDWD